MNYEIVFNRRSFVENNNNFELIKNKKMKKIFLKFSLLLAIGFATAIFTSCERNEPEVCIECDKFCLYANLENFHKTAPFINAHLELLSKNNWSDERKLQALTEWLKSHSCIIDAKLDAVWTDRDCMIMCAPGRYGSITILLDENGMTRELRLEIFGEHSKLLRAAFYSYIKPKEVRVGFKSDTTIIRDVFDFINLFNRRVLNVHRLGAGRGFLTTLPASSLDEILEVLNAKPYLSRVHGYFYQNVTID